jgi:DNA ligase (NAD+)
MTLVEKIERAKRENHAYRAGRSVVSDTEYDSHVEELEVEMDPVDFKEFLESLMEEGGDVVHSHVVGSLLKCKYGEGQLERFLSGNSNIDELFLSAKIDGMSFVATYLNGHLMKGATRGNGTTGKDITEKLRHMPSLPQFINADGLTEVRGELTFTGDDHLRLGFKKSRRSATIGAIGRSDVEPEVLKFVKAICYQILDKAKSYQILDMVMYDDEENCSLGIAEQFFVLKDLGFTVPEHMSIQKLGNRWMDVPALEEQLKGILEKWKAEADYMVDGIVISDFFAMNEESKHPSKKRAFKVDSEGVPTEVLDRVWAVSKNGLLKPRIFYSPVVIDDTECRYASGFNARWVHDNGLGDGAHVTVCKKGDIIPHVVQILHAERVLLPTECPCCGGPVAWKGVDLACENVECPARVMKGLEYFLRGCDVEGVSQVSLTKWGITDFASLLSWKPETSGSSQSKFARELAEKVFSRPAQDLFVRMSFTGCGQKTSTAILEHWGWEKAKLKMEEQMDPYGFIIDLGEGYPSGVGEKTLANIAESWLANLENVRIIIEDPRYNPKEKEAEVKDHNLPLIGVSFVLTGTLSQKRSEVEKRIISMGGDISSVNKDLSFLVCGEDQWGSSSKFKKAMNLGVKIITEEEFEKMLV